MCAGAYAPAVGDAAVGLVATAIFGLVDSQGEAPTGDEAVRLPTGPQPLKSDQGAVNSDKQRTNPPPPGTQSMSA